jgi:hypothetical protein
MITTIYAITEFRKLKDLGLNSLGLGKRTLS